MSRGTEPPAEGVPAEGVSAEEAPLEEVPTRGLLALRLGEARFGLWVDEVLEIVRTPPISRLPLSHRELVGVTSVRGEVIPVLDLGVRLLDSPAARPGRLVLVRDDETETIVGLLVDDVETLVTVGEEVRPPPKAAAAALPADLVVGVVSHDQGVVTILHLGRAAAAPGTDSNED